MLAEEARDPARVAEEALWAEVLSPGDVTLGRLDLDPVRDVWGTAQTLELELPPEVTGQLLSDVPAAFFGGVNEVLLAALGLAVCDQGRGSSVLVEMEGHGREEIVPGVDLSRTVGWFTSVFPVRLDFDGIDVGEALAGGPALGAAVKRIKERLRSLPDHGLGYGLLRYLNPRVGPRLAAAEERAEAQILFNYLGRSDVTSGGDWTTAPENIKGGVDALTPMAHVLTINAMTHDRAGGPYMSISVSWPEALLTEDAVRELLASWSRTLEALVVHAGEPGAGGHTPSDFPLVALSQSDADGVGDDVEDVWPLSPVQEGMVFHALYDDEAVDVYTGQFAFDLDGPLSVPDLRAACQALIDRHASLRAGFRLLKSGAPVQVVAAGAEVPWREEDVRSLGPDERDARLARILDEERFRRFDLGRPPLVRFALVRLGVDRWRFVLTNHHIVLDGWSMPLVFQELFALYAGGGRDDGLPRARPYRDYVRWLSGQDRNAAELAWSEALEGVAEPTRLIPDPGVRAPGMPEHFVVEYPQEKTAALDAWARRRGLTLNTVVQAVWGVVVGRLTGRGDVVFGATVSGRPPEVAGVESMVGLFINTVPVRVRLDPSLSLRELLEQVQEEQVRLMAHQHLGLSQIQRLIGQGELFDTVTVFENYPVDSNALAAAEGLRLLNYKFVANFR
jgi:non-ribosomal peptide synthase protein (TIGR01720 family)